MHLQAPAPRTAIAPSIISGPLLRDSYSESSLRMGASPEVHLSKRRRQSNTSSGSERSWDSPDSSSQFGGLMGPGMKPRRLSSGARTEPHLSTSSRDAEEASALRSRMSPPRDQPARKQLLAEEHSFQSHALDHRGPAPSAAVLVDEGRQILATEDPQSNGHHDSRSNVGLNSPPRKISRSGLIQEKWDTLPSPPHSQAFLTPLEQLASPPSASQRESLMREGNEERSPRARTPPHDNLPSSVAAVTSSAEMQSAASPEKTMVSTAPPLSTMQERSVMPVESLSPDNQMTAKQGDPVAPPTSDAYNDLPGSTELVQQPSPLSTTEVHDADVAQTAPDHESLQRTSSISPPPCQDALNQLSPEQETDPPPPTAPLPRVSSPDALSSKDEMTIDHSVVTGMDAASKTDVVTPVLESNNPVNAETSLNPLEGLNQGCRPLRLHRPRRRTPSWYRGWTTRLPR
ncbi:hypothetical protein B0F90DRAFT_55907 [Multifurca ochricompacta]|uniref:Uncharacterized protein n=1 Tax=Multifurca ochricompacta TaxID=376703 RepID=A0AAD4MCB6_9AGAM|nr:hypothetical protein B0F90DRAFT_55907 [Multifurca ochricompacta]